MTTINVSVPKDMRDFVEAQAAAGDYTTSEYIRYLIRQDKKRNEEEKFAKLNEYLARAEKQIAQGKVSKPNFEDITRLSKAMRKKKGKPASKRSS
jgi:putative addiction module CopG family antidote